MPSKSFDPVQAFLAAVPESNLANFWRPQFAIYARSRIAAIPDSAATFMKLVEAGCEANELLDLLAEVARWPTLIPTATQKRVNRRLQKLRDSLSQCATAARSLSRERLVDRRYLAEIARILEEISASASVKLQPLNVDVSSRSLPRNLAHFELVESVRAWTGDPHFTEVANLIAAVSNEHDAAVTPDSVRKSLSRLLESFPEAAGRLLRNIIRSNAQGTRTTDKKVRKT